MPLRFMFHALRLMPQSLGSWDSLLTPQCSKTLVKIVQSELYFAQTQNFFTMCCSKASAHRKPKGGGLHQTTFWAQKNVPVSKFTMKKKKRVALSLPTHIDREKVSAGDDVDLFILLVKHLENKACNWVHFPFHQIILTIQPIPY